MLHRTGCTNAKGRLHAKAMPQDTARQILGTTLVPQ